MITTSNSKPINGSVTLLYYTFLILRAAGRSVFSLMVSFSDFNLYCSKQWPEKVKVFSAAKMPRESITLKIKNEKFMFAWNR